MLAQLCRSDNRMLARVRVFARVPVRRAVAAERDATRLARAQVNPATANLHAFFAFAALRLLDCFDCIQMRAAAVVHDWLTVVRFYLVMRYVVMRGSCGFRPRPCRLRRPPLRNASLILNGRHRLQRLREDWFRAERGVVC